MYIYIHTHIYIYICQTKYNLFLTMSNIDIITHILRNDDHEVYYRHYIFTK